jgi:hypothetical protein
MHGAKHEWARIGWLSDLAHVLHRLPDVEWAEVWGMAKTSGATRMVSVALLLLQNLLLCDGTLTAAALAEHSPDRAAREIAAQVRHRLLYASTYGPEKDHALQLRFRNRWREKGRYIFHIVAEPWPADVTAIRLPFTLRGAYYVIRPFRLAWKYLLARSRSTRTI